MDAPYPFTHERLSKALEPESRFAPSKVLEPECRFEEIVLTQHGIGDLHLPTGALVACDPIILYELEPFSLSLPSGSYPVVLSVAEFGSDQRVAFATIRVKKTAPARWMMMTVDQPSTPQRYGYGVDCGTGCFMDRIAADILKARMKEKEFSDAMIAEMRKTYRPTWDWINLPLADANLIAFSSGYGDGMYPTIAGLDERFEITVVITDFIVIPLPELR